MKSTKAIFNTKKNPSNSLFKTKLLSTFLNGKFEVCQLSSFAKDAELNTYSLKNQLQ